tara:strand:+ start:32867 stop:33571 length:705 start_codon:yes stop_codon:yes gene_type:complete
MSAPAMMRLDAIGKEFKTGTTRTIALENIDLTIEVDEFLAIKGQSGSGKSTLLNILGLIDRASRGSIEWRGKSITSLGDAELTRLRREQIGFVFQSFNLIEDLNIRQNIELPLRYRRLGASERRQRTDSILEQLDIAHRANHMPRQLSGGQQQRAAIARAVVGQPALILADEPTGNLDSANGAEVMELLSDLNAAGTAIVMVTHSDVAAGYAKRTIELRDGRRLEGDEGLPHQT